MILLLQYTHIFATVLFLAALGGCFSEHSGVMNIGIEGMMVMGALGGTLTMKLLSHAAPFVMVVCTLLAAVAAGMVWSFLLSVPAVNFKADQTLIGTAVNMLSVAAATVIVKAVNFDVTGKASPTITYIEEKEALSFTAGAFRVDVFFLIAAAVAVLSVYVFKKTRFGLRLCACGENPKAAASAGVNVRKMRYLGVLISGALSGLAGLAYVTSSVSSWQFDKGVAGYGFLALAVMIFGQWDPVKIVLAALVFGFFRALSNVYMGIGFLNALNVPGAVYNMLPYIISLLILVIFSKKSHAPKASGIPY